jgi:hypothetical protein
VIKGMLTLASQCQQLIVEMRIQTYRLVVQTVLISRHASRRLRCRTL